MSCMFPETAVDEASSESRENTVLTFADVSLPSPIEVKTTLESFFVFIREGGKKIHVSGGRLADNKTCDLVLEFRRSLSAPACENGRGDGKEYDLGWRMRVSHYSPNHAYKIHLLRYGLDKHRVLLKRGRDFISLSNGEVVGLVSAVHSFTTVYRFMICKEVSTMPGLGELEQRELPDEVLFKIISLLPWSSLVNSVAFVSKKMFNIIKSLEYFNDVPSFSDVDLSESAKSTDDVAMLCSTARYYCRKLRLLRMTCSCGHRIGKKGFLFKPLTSKCWPLLTHLHITDCVAGFNGRDLGKILIRANLPALRVLEVVPKNEFIWAGYLLGWDLPLLTSLKLRIDSHPSDEEQAMFFRNFPEIEMISLFCVDMEDIIFPRTIVGYALRNGYFQDHLLELRVIVVIGDNSPVEKLNIFDDELSSDWLPHAGIKLLEVAAIASDVANICLTNAKIPTKLIFKLFPNLEVLLLPSCVEMLSFDGVDPDSLKQLKTVGLAPGKLYDVPFSLMESLCDVMLSVRLLVDVEPGTAFEKLLQLPKLRSLTLEGDCAFDIFARGLPLEGTFPLEALKFRCCRVDLNKSEVAWKLICTMKSVPKLKELFLETPAVRDPFKVGKILGRYVGNVEVVEIKEDPSVEDFSGILHGPAGDEGFDGAADSEYGRNVSLTFCESVWMLFSEMGSDRMITFGSGGTLVKACKKEVVA